MKNFLKTLLVIIFIPIFVVTVIAASIKFQLLSPEFWKSSLSQHNVYKELSQTVKIMASSKTIKGGGNPQDIKILTDIATPELIKDFMEKNITNILDYANGKRSDLTAYIPISKLPKNLAPKSVGLSSEELPLASLMSKFNINQDFIPLSQIGILGKTINSILIITSILLVIILLTLLLLSETEKKFVSIGVVFVLSGVIVEIMVYILEFIKLKASKMPLVDPNFGTSILHTIVPVILSDALKLWGLVGIITIILGIVIFGLTKIVGKFDRV